MGKTRRDKLVKSQAIPTEHGRSRPVVPHPAGPPSVAQTKGDEIFPGGPTRGEIGIPDTLHPLVSAAVSKPLIPPGPREEPRPTGLTLGAVGTLFTSGFLTDLQEYNAQFIGRQAFPVYDKMRRTSADVAAALAACMLPVLSAEWQVVPALAPNEPGYRFSVELADRVRNNLFGGLEMPMRTGGWSSQTLRSVLSNALLCLPFGCAAHEDIWDVDGEWIRLRAMAPRLPITFYRWWVDWDGLTLLALEQLGYRRNVYANVIVPAQKIAVFTINQEGANFFGRSILRAAYVHWYYLDNLARLDGIAAEHNAVGIPYIKQAPGAATKDIEAAKQYVTELAGHESLGLTTPDGFEFEMKGVEGKTYDVVRSMEYHSDKIYMAVLAGFLTLGKTHTGSYAVGDTLGDFFNLAENATAELVAEVVNQTTVRRLIDYNYELPHAIRVERMPYPLLKPAKISVLNPLKLLDAVRYVAQDNIDLIHPDAKLEDHIRKLIGWPPAEKPRVRVRALNQPEVQAGGGFEPREGQLDQKSSGGDLRLREPAAYPPYERRGLNKIGKRRQSREEERAARVLAQKLRAAKKTWVGDLVAQARRVSIPGQAQKLSLDLDEDAAQELHGAIAVAVAFGTQSVFNERLRATGRSKSEPVLNLTGIELQEGRPPKPKTPPLGVEQTALIAVARAQSWLASVARSAALEGIRRGFTLGELAPYVEGSLLEASDGAIDNAALRAARDAVQTGRMEAYREVSPEVGRWVRRELADERVCETCKARDGTEWRRFEDVDWRPGFDCEGGLLCRGDLVAMYYDEQKYPF